MIAGAGVAAAAGSLAIVGCGGGGAKRDDEEPAAGGTLRFGTSLLLSYGLDPQIESGSGLTIFPKAYGYLFHVDPRADELLLDHAASVEQPDPTTYLIRLRDDVRFHDVAPANGRTVAADDVVRSIERYRDNPLVVNKTWHTTVLDRAETVDARTVRVTTKRPYAYSLHELGAINAGAILPREAMDQQQSLLDGGAGSGPLIIDNVSLPSSVRLRRNDAYAGDAALVDAMEWHVFASDAEKLDALRSLSIDSAPMRDRREADEAATIGIAVQLRTERSLAYLSLGLRSDRPPFGDPRVRQAIDIALDRASMIRDVAFGDADVTGPVNPHMAEGFWSLPADEVARAQGGVIGAADRQTNARQLLAAAGAEGATIRIQVADQPQLVDVATVVRTQLAPAGLNVELQTLDLLTWFVNFRRGDFDATLISQLPYEWPDTPTRLYHSGGADGANNMFGYKDPAIDALVERSWGEADRRQRQATLLEAQRLMVAARPMVHLFSGMGYTATWGHVRGFPEETGSLAQYAYRQWLRVPVDGRVN
ncbi:MAG TPA: ABC transporter substrate-binding protein [Dehalococcoidia bacterium]